MSLRGFFDATMQAEVGRVVEEIEARTSSEVVVCVRRWSSSYLAAAFLAGALVAFVVLLLLLFLPQEFRVETMPIDVLLGFALGFGLARLVPPIRRWLTLPGTRRAEVARAASAQMFDGGFTRTQTRAAVLVYVSILERRVVVRTDEGLAALRDDAVWLEASAKLEAAVRRLDESSFLEALRKLGNDLARLSPRREDDVNELPDAVDA
jgi:putative membrane protein